MKHISLILVLAAMLFAFAVPSFAELLPQETSCTDGFVGGDVDGDGNVNAKDANQLLKYLAGWTIPGDASHADTLRDGVVNAKDASKLLKYLAGWNVGRLCHDDEYVVVEESTVDKQGVARTVCRVCGDVAAEEELPYKIFSVCGTDISEYRVLYSANGICGDDVGRVSRLFIATTEELWSGDFIPEKASSQKMFTKKVYEHEILIGDVSKFKRDGLPDMSDGQPCYGVTEDGTVYFNARSYGLFNEEWLEFLREQFGIYFTVIANYDANIVLDSYNENGADAQPFCRRYTPIDLEADGYKLVFEDEFNGDSIDWDLWQCHGPGASGAGWDYAISQCTERDGYMVLTCEYRDDGFYGPGRYGAEIELKDRYLRGYFECRMKCGQAGGLSAFWMQGVDPYVAESSQGGIGPGGAEIDIIEVFGNNAFSTVHCAGASFAEGPGLNSFYSDEYNAGDVYNEFHTYALEWDEDYYTFYVDGIIVSRTNHADGTATIPESVIIGYDLASNCDTVPESVSDEMLVEYIRIYQK